MMPDHHPDDREPLAYAYNGSTLAAIGYTDAIVDHWKHATDYDVVPTPTGETPVNPQDGAE